MFRYSFYADTMWKDSTEDIGGLRFRSRFFTTYSVKVKKFFGDQETRNENSVGIAGKYGHSSECRCRRS